VTLAFREPATPDRIGLETSLGLLRSGIESCATSSLASGSAGVRGAAREEDGSAGAQGRGGAESAVVDRYTGAGMLLSAALGKLFLVTAPFKLESSTAGSTGSSGKL
jgi:hypothetical protein